MNKNNIEYLVNIINEQQHQIENLLIRFEKIESIVLQGDELCL